MTSELKPCPFCGSKEVDLIKSESNENDPYHAVCECGGSSFSEAWNNRPQEKLLKSVIDEFLDGLKYVLDNEYTHNMNKRKLRQVRVTVIAMLTGKAAKKK